MSFQEKSRNVNRIAGLLFKVQFGGLSLPIKCIHGFAGQNRPLRINRDPVESCLRRLQTARKVLPPRADLVAGRGESTRKRRRAGTDPVRIISDASPDCSTGTLGQLFSSTSCVANGSM